MQEYNKEDLDLEDHKGTGIVEVHQADGVAKGLVELNKVIPADKGEIYDLRVLQNNKAKNDEYTMKAAPANLMEANHVMEANPANLMEANHVISANPANLMEANHVMETNPGLHI